MVSHAGIRVFLVNIRLTLFLCMWRSLATEECRAHGQTGSLPVTNRKSSKGPTCSGKIKPVREGVCYGSSRVNGTEPVPTTWAPARWWLRGLTGVCSHWGLSGGSSAGVQPITCGMLLAGWLLFLPFVFSLPGWELILLVCWVPSALPTAGCSWGCPVIYVRYRASLEPPWNKWLHCYGFKLRLLILPPFGSSLLRWVHG